MCTKSTTAPPTICPFLHVLIYSIVAVPSRYPPVPFVAPPSISSLFLLFLVIPCEALGVPVRPTGTLYNVLVGGGQRLPAPSGAAARFLPLKILKGQTGRTRK